MDEDGNGSISRGEFRNSYINQKKEKKDEKSTSQPFFSDSFFDIIDANGSESITFRELVKAMYPQASKEELTEIEKWAFPKEAPKKKVRAELSPEQQLEIEAIFKLYDRDGSGSINLQELKNATLSLGMGKGEVEKMFSSMDSDQDGTVTLAEFIEAMKMNYIIPEEESPLSSRRPAVTIQ
jgi:calmodulin